jgi:hypothetical protein
MPSRNERREIIIVLQFQAHRAGGPIRPIVAPCGSHIVFATVAGLRLVGGADQALSGCKLNYVRAQCGRLLDLVRILMELPMCFPRSDHR